MRSRTRTFLDVANSDSDAYVATTFMDDWADLKIADCHRSISLGFDHSTKRKNKYIKFKKIMLKFFKKMDKMLGLEEEIE